MVSGLHLRELLEAWVESGFCLCLLQSVCGRKVLFHQILTKMFLDYEGGLTSGPKSTYGLACYYESSEDGFFLPSIRIKAKRVRFIISLLTLPWRGGRGEGVWH